MAKVLTPHHPTLSKGLNGTAADKITSRLRLFVESDEHVSGIYKPTGFRLQAVVVTNYRIIGVKPAESHGNVVFTNEVQGEDMQSILLQAKRNIFGRIAYDVIIDRNGKKKKFATVKRDDADSLLESLENVQLKDSLASVESAQQNTLIDEQANRNQIKSVKKEISELERNSELLELKSLISTNGLLDSLNTLSLYFDRIEQSGGRAVGLKDQIEITTAIEGSLHTTQEPIAGSKKRGKVQTKSVTHDDRKIKIEVNGNGGYLSTTLPFSQEAAVNNFISKSKNTQYDYRHQEKMLTEAEYLEQLHKKVEQVKIDIGLNDKYQQLTSLQNKMS